MASTPSRLTRGALKKLNGTPNRGTPTRDTGRGPSSSHDANAAAAGDEEQDASNELLLQEYRTFQHGLTPVKRRRVTSDYSGNSNSSRNSADAENYPLSRTTPGSPGIAASPSSAAGAGAAPVTPPLTAVAPATPPTRASPIRTPLGAVECDNCQAPSPPLSLTAPVGPDDQALPEPVVVVPVVEVALATEEKKMEGAPEGELYIVTVLASSEITPSLDVDAEVAAVQDVLHTKAAVAAASSSSSNASSSVAATDGAEELSWAKEYAALDSLRRLAIHHPDHLRPLLATSISTLVCPAATNLRSAMARNALLCLNDILHVAERECEPFFHEIVPLLVYRMSNEKQFIRDLAKDVLAKCVQTSPHEPLLVELLRISTSDTTKSAQIVCSAGVVASQCIQKMPTEELQEFVAKHSQTSCFWDQMSAFLNCKVVECKVATRESLQFVRKTIGESEFTTLVQSKLEGTAQFELLKASEPRKTAPKTMKSGLPKLSMRERMLQMKKKQQQEQQDSVVVVKEDAAETKTKAVTVTTEEEGVVVVLVAGPPPPAVAEASAASSSPAAEAGATR